MLRLKKAMNRKGKTVPFNPMMSFKASSGTGPFILHLGANRRRGGGVMGSGAVVDILERRKISCLCQHSNPRSPCPYHGHVPFMLPPKYLGILSAKSIQTEICVGTKGNTTLTLRKVLENRGGWRLILRRM
jgi:hypothetical protein